MSEGMQPGQVWESRDGFRVVLRERLEPCHPWWVVDTDEGERVVTNYSFRRFGYRRVEAA